MLTIGDRPATAFPETFRLFRRVGRGNLPALVLTIALVLANAGSKAAELSATTASPLQKLSPMSAWLDLRPAQPGAPGQTVPDWVEAFEFLPATYPAANAGSAPAPAPRPGMLAAAIPPSRTVSVYRVRIKKPAQAPGDLQVRLFFDDLPDEQRPRVTAWDELGNELMRSRELGAGLNLPTSETVTVPMKGVNYLEFDCLGDGSQLRGAFLTWLTTTKIKQPVDFPIERGAKQPFHILSASRKVKNDGYLYGVVTAGLQADPILLRPPAASSAAFEFELEKQPLLTVVTFETLGATVSAPPTISVNGHLLGTADLFLPDLADPAYQGESRELDPQMTFRYTGWLRGQKVIPGGWLTAGLNSLSVELSNGSDPIAVRAVNIQLKYNWEKLDYILSPPPVPSFR